MTKDNDLWSGWPDIIHEKITELPRDLKLNFISQTKLQNVLERISPYFKGRKRGSCYVQRYATINKSPRKINNNSNLLEEFMTEKSTNAWTEHPFQGNMLSPNAIRSVNNANSTKPKLLSKFSRPQNSMSQGKKKHVLNLFRISKLKLRKQA